MAKLNACCILVVVFVCLEASVAQPSPPNQCRVLSSVKNGERNCTNGTNGFREQCVFWCNNGSRLVKGSTIRNCSCSAEGVCKWNGKHTFCEKIPKCRVLSPVENAERNCVKGNTTYQEKCTFQCKPGSRLLKGSLVRTCTCSQSACKWNGRHTFCEKIPTVPPPKCRAMSHGTNAVRTCVEGNANYQQKCTFQCKPGFKLSRGSLVRTCTCSQSACKWDGKHVFCQKIQTTPPPKCRALSHGTNAMRTCVKGNASYQQKCTFQCKPGFKLSRGSLIRTCTCSQSTCKWDGRHTFCQKIITPAPALDRRQRCSGRKGRLPRQSYPTPISFTPSSDSTKYDYHELLHKSLLFYDAQRSGYKTNTSRVPWRGDSDLHDGCDVGRDLTGGWHDAGDHVKFGFPIASATTVLAWGMILFKDAYVEAGEWQNALDNLKWSTDYFIKAHAAPNVLYGQVGGGVTDHDHWGRPEEATIRRPSFKITASSPGSDLAGETAAAMAASSIVFKAEGMASYATELLNHATELYQFASRYRGFYHKSIPDATEYYKSYDYKDEIVWACLWIYKATKSPVHLRDCTSKYNGFHMFYVASEFSWSSKTAGIQLLMAESTNQQKYRDVADKFVVFARDTVPKTPGGLAFFGKWGSNRYAANAAFIALATAATTRSRGATKWVNFARQQIYCLLGDGDNKRSYVVGFGTNPPTHVHHKASSCPTWRPGRHRICTWADFSSSRPNPHVLYGALVGGPDKNGRFSDTRKNYVINEVSCDYNAGFQSAIAGLKHFVMQSRSG